jgi:hypothetical protein
VFSKRGFTVVSVVIGEIISGMNIFESINAHGRFIRFDITHNSDH